MNYFILVNDAQLGPFTIEELAARGLRQDTLVWCEGMAQWTPAWQVEELKPLTMGQQPTPPPPPLATPTPPPAPPRQDGETGRTAGDPEKHEKRSSHKGLWAFLIIMVIVLFVLALTNPGVAEHRKAILDRIDTATEQTDDIGDPTLRGIVSGMMGFGNGMVKGVVRQLVDENLEYHNYIFFSTTTLKSGLLRKEIRTSTGFLGHVDAVSLANILPDMMMRQMGIGDGVDNGITEQTTTTVDSDGNETTETTKTTRKNGITVDSLTKRVTNRIADEVAGKVKKEVRQQSDSSTASGIEQIVDDVVRFVKGL